jgi:D,D-heptose 1,7-bisphosphate phosphatase
MRQAVILVGGRGTRLGEIARHTPKPLLPIIGDTRFIDYLLENFARHGVEDIILLAGHLAETVVERYDGARVREATVRVICEPQPAGTGGALRYAADVLDDAFFMANGDGFLDFNYLALAQQLGPSDEGALALRFMSDAARYGRVEFINGRVHSFHEKDASFQGSAYVSGGIYALRKSVLRLVQRLPCSIETDVFPKLAAEGALTGYATDGYFIDIGLPDTLKQGREDLPQLMRRRAVLFDRDGTLNRDSGYTHRPEQLEWMPGAIEAIRKCNDAGQLVIVVSNQAGVARGLYAEADVHRFHAQMQNQLRAHGAHIDAFYYCPHHGGGTIAEYTHDNHPDRKPNAGMLRRALLEWSVRDALMLGDTEADVAAGNAAGVKAKRVEEGRLLESVEDWLRQPRQNPGREPLIRNAASTAKTWLFEIALPLWWNAGYDKATACFFEQLDEMGQPIAYLDRRTFVQARQVIVYAKAGRLGWTGPWREAVESGARVLIERCIRDDGGTVHTLGPDGRTKDQSRDLYDLAFVVFALAEASIALGGRPDFTAAAEELINWLDANWRHQAGGFLEGDIAETPPRRQNPHMHMFEAALSLFEATGDASHLSRAEDISTLLAEKLADARTGALREYFDDAWRRLEGNTADICEPGHQFEWCWLLYRCRALNGSDRTALAERLRVHAEVYGVNSEGIVFDEIEASGMPRTTSSRFWPHTERAKANLARFEATGDHRAAEAALQALDMIWRYCDTVVPGGWRDRRQNDGSYAETTARASSLYHVVLALSELIRVAEFEESRASSHGAR